VADDDLEFGFELVDEASSPAGKIHRELERLERDLKQLDRASGQHMGGVGESFQGVGVGAVAMGSTIGGVATKVIAGAAQMAAAVAVFAGQAALQFGQAAIGAATFREKSELALSLLRHGENGAAQFEHIKDIALELGTPLNDTVKSFQKLAAMQFSEASAETFFKRMQDLRAVGADADQTGRALLAITQIKATGHLQGDELLQLADAGVSVQLVMQELAKATGKTVEEVDKLKSAGKISADMALDAIDKAIGKKTGAAVAGDAGKRFADSTISGMSDRIANLGGILLDDVGKELTPALLRLKPLLDDVFKGLQSDSFKQFLATAGKALGEIVDGVLELKPILNDVFAGLTGDTSQAVMMDVAHAIRAVLETARDAWPIVKQLLGGMGDGMGEGFKALEQIAVVIQQAFGGKSEADMQKMGELAREVGHALGLMVVDFLAVAAAVGALIAAGIAVNAWLFGLKTDIDNFLKGLGTMAHDGAVNFIDGLVNGLNAGVARVQAAVAGLGSNTLIELAHILRLGSPSKETDWMGQMAGAGLVGGVESMIPAAQKAMGELGAVRAPPPVEDPIRIAAPQASPRGLGGSANMNVNVNNTVNGAKDPKETGRHVGDKTKGGVIDELERFAAELGA